MRLWLLKLSNKNKVDLKSKMHVRLQHTQKTHEKEYGELSLFISVFFDLVFIKHQKVVLL